METYERQGIVRWAQRRRVPLVVLVVLLVALAAFLAVCHGLEPLLYGRVSPLLPDYGTWFSGVQEYDPFSWFLWYVGDVTECSFMKSIPASVCYLALTLFGASLATNLAAVDHRDQGPWPHVGRSLAFAMLSLLISCAVCAPLVDRGWLPTFTAFLMTQILIGFTGGSLAECATVAVFCGLTMGPLGTLIIYTLTAPLGLPGFVGTGTGMAMGTVIDCEIMRRLPWMHLSDPKAAPPASGPAPRRTMSQARWDMVAGIFRDLSDMCGTGTVAGGVGLALGLMLGWELSPHHGFYGSPAENLLAVLMATSALGIFLHYPTFRREGYAYTLPALLTMGSIASTYPDSLPINLASLLVVASLAPWAARVAIKRLTFMRRWPSSVVMQTVAALCTTLVAVAVKAFMMVLG